MGKKANFCYIDGMIGQLTGQVSHKGDRFIILEVVGVGYHVNLSLETLKRVEKEQANLKFWTYLAVRENALDLYGFLEQRELEFFELLISVSGIGPKSAITILSLAPPETLEKAITSSDAGYLTKVSGIGKKSAEKIVLELKDKLSDIAGLSDHELRGESEAIEALQALGYSLREAREALKNVPDTIIDTGEKVKQALKKLGK